MLTPEDRKIQAMIANAMRPLMQRVDRLETNLRRLKSDLNQVKNAVNRIKK